jgi:hypothetical protein
LKGLITAFVITHQGILNLTTEDFLISVDVYVAYRRLIPDEETVKDVKKLLKENNIEYSQLEEWPTKNCKEAESSLGGGCSD